MSMQIAKLFIYLYEYTNCYLNFVKYYYPM